MNEEANDKEMSDETREPLLVKTLGALGTALGYTYRYTKIGAKLAANLTYDGLGKLTGNPTRKQHEEDKKRTLNNYYVNDEAQQVLNKIVSKYGLDETPDKKRYETLLNDYFDEEKKRERYLLLNALDCGIVEEIIKIKDSFEEADLIALSNRLMRNYGIAEEMSVWAVKAWHNAIAHKFKLP